MSSLLEIIGHIQHLLEYLILICGVFVLNNQTKLTKKDFYTSWIIFSSNAFWLLGRGLCIETVQIYGFDNKLSTISFNLADLIMLFGMLAFLIYIIKKEILPK